MKLTLKDGSVVEDTNDTLVKNESGEITCGCKNSKLKCVSHINCIDFYSYNYVCQCGNHIILTSKRNKESMW